MVEFHERWFNPLCDVNEVDQFGYVDLVEAFANNSVPTVIGDDDVAYNNIADPNAVLPMARDVFEAMHQNQTVHDYVAPDSEEQTS